MRLIEVVPESDAGVAARLLEIQHAAYAIEAEIIGDDRIPPLHEDLAGLRDAGLRWIAATEGGEIVGALAYTADGSELDIDRLVVDPAWSRRGIGIALVSQALQRAQGMTVVVSTGRANHPARGLYERLGFQHLQDVEVIDKLWISRYRYITTSPKPPQS